tara:strand:- start:533 stop:2620 length:2088 start_codon:yes stop_codon:yes gene_type:complete
MFRDPMAARQASGILASSPQLANVVQQRQPVRMQTGGSQEIAVLAQAAGQGDMSAVAKLQSIASSNTTPAALRSAAAEVLNLPSISRIANQKQDAKDFFSSIRKGPESQVDVGVAGIDNSGPFITAGVNPDALSNVLSDATGRKPGTNVLGKSLESQVDIGTSGIAGALDFMPNVNALEARRAGTTFDPAGNKTQVRDRLAKTEKFRQDKQNIAAANQMELDPFVKAAIAQRLENQANVMGTAQDSEFMGANTSVNPTDRLVDSSGAVSVIPEERLRLDAAPAKTVAERIAEAKAAQEALAPKTSTSTNTTENTVTTVTAPTVGKKKDATVKTGDALVDAAMAPTTRDPSGMLSQTTPKKKAGERTLKEVLDSFSNLPTKEQEKGVAEPSKKQRVEEEYNILKDLIGSEKAEDIRTSANYNLIMTGLMIAAGEDPNALVNIAKGSAAGLAGYGEAVGEAAKEENAEDRALKIQAASTVTRRMETEAANKFTTSEREANQIFRASETDRLAIINDFAATKQRDWQGLENQKGIDAAAEQNKANRQLQTDIANAKNALQIKIAKDNYAFTAEQARQGRLFDLNKLSITTEIAAQARIDEQEFRRELAEIPSGTLAIYEKYLTPEQVVTALTQKGTLGEMLSPPSKGRFQSEFVKDENRSAIARDQIAQKLGVDPDSITEDVLMKFAGKVYDQAKIGG